MKYAISITDEQVRANTPIMLSGSFAQCFQAAAECGYEGVELQIKDPVTRNAGVIQRLMREYHLAVPAITTGMEYFGNGLSLISDDPDIQRRAVDRLIEHVDLAAKLESMVLLGSMRGVIDDFARYDQMEIRLINNILKVLTYAERCGVDVVLEPINFYINNYINSLDEGAAFVRKVNSNRFWLMIDTHHMYIHDGDMFEAILRNKDLIRYVHYSDSNRLYPGGGNINFLQCTKALLEIEYSGWTTMECLALANGKRCAERALNYSRRLEAACMAITEL